ncbi:MAG: hypothetical protein ACJ75G_09600 [Gaiellaceae bacterium]
MNDDDKRWKGQGEKLKDAFDDAWDKAKGNGAEPGKYVVERIEIETSNPIHSYSVIIVPAG